jgi:hypothetical protein
VAAYRENLMATHNTACVCVTSTIPLLRRVLVACRDKAAGLRANTDVRCSPDCRAKAKEGDQ